MVATEAQFTGSDQQSGVTVSPIKLAHVVFKTSRFREMIDWYRLVLNGTMAFADEGIAFLAYDDEHHRIAFINVPGLGEQVGKLAGVHHVAFTYATLEQLLDNHARLAERGIAPAWSVNHGPTTSLYYADPDGNHLEFQVDNYETVEEAGKFFFTDAFATNPIGVDFDPVELRRRLKAGEDEDQLKQRPASGQRGVDSIPLR
ncbi:VOC family protein [Sphingobium phenoxybenzoativorans]|uniref:VOC family protein n=1 Tax=Sphingobium phenoxybenzoativorans TaxID=1592790 RepID=UPI000872B756|nr:VOC family protein [Sphingobium phenoxybenzoativorans]